MRYNYKGLFLKHGTVGVFIYDKRMQSVFIPLIQFSFKKPWLLPKIDKEYFKKVGIRKDKGGHGWLAGWMFFYIGYCTCYNKGGNYDNRN